MPLKEILKNRQPPDISGFHTDYTLRKKWTASKLKENEMIKNNELSKLLENVLESVDQYQLLFINLLPCHIIESDNDYQEQLEKLKNDYSFVKDEFKKRTDTIKYNIDLVTKCLRTLQRLDDESLKKSNENLIDLAGSCEITNTFYHRLLIKFNEFEKDYKKSVKLNLKNSHAVFLGSISELDSSILSYKERLDNRLLTLKEAHKLFRPKDGKTLF